MTVPAAARPGAPQFEPPQHLDGLVGTHVIYTYANGWQYELYVRNERACDYRIHHGLVGGRWVKNQDAHMTRIDDGTYKIDWHEPTGTCVSLLLDLPRRLVHGTIFFPQWIGGEGQHPERTICFQNDFVHDMRAFRDAGPAYPYVIIAEFARITYVEQCGRDNESVIDAAPGQLPPGYTDRTN
ncbi:phenolic acid decarboxylase [Nonomuraea candida]|uniref:phenolic acid decarboxylase n=1 Tax=Nonomuraea candida TaxID=359159 RepID=UPI0006948E10|nr:phenolic acid decarboxylase [Nonomuraea candida]